MDNNIRYNRFIQLDWDRIVYNAKVMNIAKNKNFLRKLIYSGKVVTSQTNIPKFDIGEIGNTNSRNKLRHLYFKRLCDYIDVYQNKFGDDWDIHFQKEYMNGKEGYIIFFFRIFDKVTVTKYDGEDNAITSHNITDLMVFNTIGMKDNGDFWIPRMKGVRLSYSAAEISSGYRHSHLDSSSSLTDNPDYISNFCIGSNSDTSLLSGLLNTSFSKEQFEIYLYAQDSTIECESSIGTPHISFSTIFQKTQKSLSPSTSDLFVFSSYLINNISLETIDVNYYISNNNYCIKKDDVFHSFIKNALLTTEEDEWKKYLCKRGQDDNYFSYESFKKKVLSSSNIQIRKDSNDLKPPYIYYRGEKKEFKVHKEQPRKENEQLKIEEFIIYPNLLNTIHEQLEHKLQQKAIAASNIKRYYSRSNVASYLR